MFMNESVNGVNAFAVRVGTQISTQGDKHCRLCASVSCTRVTGFCPNHECFIPDVNLYRPFWMHGPCSGTRTTSHLRPCLAQHARLLMGTPRRTTGRCQPQFPTTHVNHERKHTQTQLCSLDLGSPDILSPATHPHPQHHDNGKQRSNSRSLFFFSRHQYFKRSQSSIIYHSSV